MTHWDAQVARKLRDTLGLSFEHIGHILGLIAEHRMQADHEGYKRGFEQGYEKGLAARSNHPGGCRCPVCCERQFE